MSWKKVKLAELCRIEKGTTGIQKAIPGKYPLVVTSEERKSHNEYQFDDEVVAIPLVSSTGHGHRSLNRIHLQKGKFALGSILCVVIPYDKKILSAEYLYRYLDLNRESELVSRMRGMANVTLPMKEIGQIEIPLPPLVEQKKFVASYQILEKKNNALSTELTYQLDLVKQLRQAFLREAMQGKLVPQYPSDEPAGELLKKIKKEKEKLIKERRLKIGKSTGQSVSLVEEAILPSTWLWCKTDEIFFITKLAGFEYTKHISLKKVGEIPVVRAQNVRPFIMDKTNLVYIDSKTSKLLDRCSLTKKCLLVTFIGAGIGDVATFDENGRWHLAPNVAKMEPFEGCESLLSVKYVNYFLMSELGQREIFKHVKATAQPSLSMGTIRDIDLPLPPLSEQHRIVAKLEQLMSYCDELEASINQSQTQNEQLLQQVLREALSPDKKPKGKSYKMKEVVSMAAEE